MPDEAILARLTAIEMSIAEATAFLESIRTDLGINSRIEAANTREIEKLKRHVAELQSKARAGTNPEPIAQPIAS